MCRLSDLDGEPCFLGRLGGNASSSGSSDSVLELLGRNLRYVVRFVARFRFELGAAPELSELSLSELSTPMSLLSELSLSELRICGL